MRPLRVFVSLATILLGASRPTIAQGPPPAPPGAGDHLSVYLLTMGTGDAVWEKFGHNAFWIHDPDPVEGSDWVFNYGVFDFDSPGYWSRFIEGDWLYQLAVADIGQTLAQYEYLNRTVVAQELDLTSDQKAELKAFLEWNFRPENRVYLYDYFRDNCSTRIRDVLDRVLDGRFRAATDTVPTGTTYRWHSRRLMAGEPVVYTGLNAGLGPPADQRISAWEEMFLPEKVKERVREMRIDVEGGTARPLVRSERVLYQARGRAEDRDAPPAWIPQFLLVGVVLAAGLVLLARGASRSSASRFGFALLGSVWALLIGTGGMLLFGLWAFTNHTIVDGNENLLQFDPLALPLVVLLPAVMYGARWARGPARILSTAIAVISVLGLLLQLLPELGQVNGEIIALVLPANVALAWAVGRVTST